MAANPSPGPTLPLFDTPANLDHNAATAYVAAMIVRPIIHVPDPRLKTVSDAVERVDGEVRDLMTEMMARMHEANGIGLAAIQIGVASRVVVMDLAREGEEPQPMAFANPEIIWRSDETKPHEEGCLSIPDIYETVVRPAKVGVRYLDRDGNRQEIDVEGLFAVCIQHEIDHLDGILFIDHLSKLKRGMIMKRMQKAKRLRQGS